MTDFFDRVERELTRAVEREQPSATKRRRGRIATWFASHTLIAVTGAVALGGAGAAAAVVTLQGTPSHPTTGLVPRQAGEHRVRDLRYSLTMMPGLRVGEPEWCSSNTFRLTGAKRFYGGQGCGPAPLAGRHVLGGGTTVIGQGKNRLFAFAVVDDTVAYAVLTSGERVVPASDPALPNGWRAIVLLPGQSHDGKMHFKSAAGTPVDRSPGRAADYEIGQPRVDAPTGGVPADAPCSMAVPPEASARGAHWLADPRPTPRLAGSAFLPCAQVRLRIDDAWAEATLLVDAAAPGTALPAPLTGAKASPTGRGTVELGVAEPYYWPQSGQSPGDAALRGPHQAGSTASARRSGNAWVVVRARSRALRERLLDGIRTRVAIR